MFHVEKDMQRMARQRKDASKLSPDTVAKYKRLKEQGLSTKDIAARFGCSVDWVNKVLRMAES